MHWLKSFACLLFCSGLLAWGIMGCAARIRPAQAVPPDMSEIKRQFARGEYAQSLQGCRDILARGTECPLRDEALYYAALDSLALDSQAEGGRAVAAQYFRALITERPASPYRGEAGLWLSVLKSCGTPEQAAPCAQELQRMRSENARLERELDLLKDVDVQLHRQKKGS